MSAAKLRPTASPEVLEEVRAGTAVTSGPMEAPHADNPAAQQPPPCSYSHWEQETQTHPTVPSHSKLQTMHIPTASLKPKCGSVCGKTSELWSHTESSRNQRDNVFQYILEISYKQKISSQVLWRLDRYHLTYLLLQFVFFLETVHIPKTQTLTSPKAVTQLATAWNIKLSPWQIQD